MPNFFRKLNRKGRLLQSYKTVFSGDDAKLVLENLVDEAEWCRDSYMAGRDAAAMAYQEGKKAMVNHILTCLGYDEDYIGRINILLAAKERQVARINNYEE